MLVVDDQRRIPKIKGRKESVRAAKACETGITGCVWGKKNCPWFNSVMHRHCGIVMIMERCTSRRCRCWIAMCWKARLPKFDVDVGTSC